MPTVGIVNGHNMRIFVGDVAVAKATTCSYSVRRATRSTAHKDLGTGSGAGWAGSEYGEGSWEMSGDALYAEGDSFDTLFAALSAKTKLTVEFSTDVVGDKKMTGSALITEITKNSPNNEDVTYSYTLQGDGELTRANVV